MFWVRGLGSEGAVVDGVVKLPWHGAGVGSGCYWYRLEKVCGLGKWVKGEKDGGVVVGLLWCDVVIDECEGLHEVEVDILWGIENWFGGWLEFEESGWLEIWTWRGRW